MSNIPVLKPREVIRILNKLGFEEVRQKGSHKKFRHSDGRIVTVPVHFGQDITPGLLHKISSDAGMATREFVKLR